MPNWCENILIVKAKKKEDLDKFIKKAKGKNTEFCFSSFFPCPAILSQTSSPYSGSIDIRELLIEKYGFDNWYDWALANWGTKWDVQADIVAHRDKYIKYRFDSAWGPPDVFFEKIVKMYPELTFRLKYKEEGMAFKGELP